MFFAIEGKIMIYNHHHHSIIITVIIFIPQFAKFLLGKRDGIIIYFSTVADGCC
jgi:hypothetical protein